MSYLSVKTFILSLIKFYQRTLSLDHGPLRFLRSAGQCKFIPTCSEYSYQAIEKYGLLKGGFRGFRRLIKCHPWSLGGYDPVD